MNELDLFAAALAIADPGERATFLDQQCVSQPDLRRRIAELFEAHFQLNPLLDPTNLNPLREQVAPLGLTRSLLVTDDRAGAVIDGKYTLVEPIGEGGMGSVWRAKQTEPVKRFVAIKLIKAGMDSKQVLARFDAERQALALMDHANICKVLDGGLHEYRPYFVMELVKGVPITEYCDQCKLTPKERLELFVSVCQAIQHAHQKGIIHRDVKPSNVLVALYDDLPVVKVIDFGVAKATGGTLTEATIDTGIGAVVGTPQYMSPEQATLNNLDIDTRTDIYGLGVLLYELLTGSPPFAKRELEKRGLLEILRAVREEDPPRPSTKLSTADALPTLSANRGTEPTRLTGLLRNELDWIVMKALEKNRAQRYDTANAFAADVTRYLNGEAVQAHPPSVAYRLQKFVRRNRARVTAAVLVLAALLAGIVGTTWGLFEAKKQEQVAVAARDDEAAARRREAQRADAEAKERKRADEERADAEAVKDFLTKDLLGMTNGWVKASDPEERGPNVTVHTLLDRAGRQVGKKFADRPKVELAVRRAIATSYMAIGLPREAIEHSERAMVLDRRLSGPDKVALFDELVELASLYRYGVFDLDRAEALALEALDGYLRVEGSESKGAIGAKFFLSGITSGRGRWDEAAKLQRELYEQAQRVLGPDEITTTSLRTSILMQLIGRMDYPAAELLANDALARNRRVYGEHHPATHIVARQLMVIYSRTGRTERATELGEEWLAKARQTFGDQAGDTLEITRDLAQIYSDQGRDVDAVPLLERYFLGHSRGAGLDSSVTHHAARILVECYLRLDRSSDAVAVLEKAGDGVTGDAAWSYNAARAYSVISGKTAEAHDAERYAQRAIALLRAASKQGWRDIGHVVGDADMASLLERADFRKLLSEIGKQYPKDYRAALAVLGSKLIDRQPDVAEGVLRECLALSESAAPDDWQHFSTCSLLGQALLTQKKYTEAESFLLKSFEGLKKHEKAIPNQGMARLQKNIDMLIELYTATGNVDETKKWQAEQAKGPSLDSAEGK